jgi:hypothetical protein
LQGILKMKIFFKFIFVFYLILLMSHDLFAGNGGSKKKEQQELFDDERSEENVENKNVTGVFPQEIWQNIILFLDGNEIRNEEDLDNLSTLYKLRSSCKAFKKIIATRKSITFQSKCGNNKNIKQILVCFPNLDHFILKRSINQKKFILDLKKLKVSELKNLEVIGLERCSQIKNINVLKKISKLKVINLKETSLKLKNLEIFNKDDGPIILLTTHDYFSEPTPLGKILNKELKKMGKFRNKKKIFYYLNELRFTCSENIVSELKDLIIYFPNLEKLTLCKGYLTKKCMGYLSQFKNLKHLILTGCEIDIKEDEEGLKNLKTLTHIKIEGENNLNIIALGLPSQFKNLILDKVNIKNFHEQKLDQYFISCKIDIRDLKPLDDSIVFKNIKILSIEGLSLLEDEDESKDLFQRINQIFPNLTHISIPGEFFFCESLNIDRIGGLEGLVKNLQELKNLKGLICNNLSEKDIQLIVDGSSNLKTITLPSSLKQSKIKLYKKVQIIHNQEAQNEYEKLFDKYITFFEPFNPR